MICIISGPSCAGKSTLLQSQQVQSITGFPDSTPVQFPSTLANNVLRKKQSCFLHYNTLRVARDGLGDSAFDFSADLDWQRALAMKTDKTALVMVATRSTLERRMLARKRIEPTGLRDCASNRYNGLRWLKVLESVDLNSVYLKWCLELEQSEIPYTLIHSETYEYPVLSDEQFKTLDLNR